jgi:transposase
MVRLYARSLKGEKTKGSKPTKPGKNVSIIGAMSVNKIWTLVNLIGGTDAITFEAFIIRKFVPKLWKGACVVMDNCPIHLGEEVKKAIEKTGAKLIYLSPYSPDFSLLENLWSKLKIILRSIKTTNYQELGKAIEFASHEVTERKYLEWVYSLLLLYVIFMRKAISLFSVTIIFNNYGSLPLNCERRSPP